MITSIIFESTFICFISVICALFISLAIEPIFNNLLNTNVHLVQKFNLQFFNSILLFSLVVGFICGTIPGFYITSVKQTEVIKGHYRTKKMISYSSSLISFQFFTVITLLICTGMIRKQSLFMQNYNTGFEKENIISIRNNSFLNGNNKNSYKELLAKVPGVEQVACVAGSPLDGGNNHSFNYNGNPLSFQVFIVDSNWFDMFGINVEPTTAAYSKNGIWLNKRAIKETGLPKLPVSFKDFGNEPPVLGVVDDFNFESLRSKVGCAIIYQMGENQFPWDIFVKINGKNVISTIDKIKEVHRDFTQNMPFEMKFVDQEINSWYENEVKTAQLIGYFSFLAVIISFLGILAMSLYYLQQKIKEIGIRKVNGARAKEIMLSLNTDMIKWVVMAFILACPVALYFINKWLENFAYKTELSWWIFALAGLLALTISLITVSWQSWQAARKNPVEALRYE